MTQHSPVDHSILTVRPSKLSAIALRLPDEAWCDLHAFTLSSPLAEACLLAQCIAYARHSPLAHLMSNCMCLTFAGLTVSNTLPTPRCRTQASGTRARLLFSVSLVGPSSRLVKTIAGTLHLPACLLQLRAPLGTPPASAGSADCTQVTSSMPCRGILSVPHAATRGCAGQSVSLCRQPAAGVKVTVQAGSCRCTCAPRPRPCSWWALHRRHLLRSQHPARSGATWACCCSRPIGQELPIAAWDGLAADAGLLLRCSLQWRATRMLSSRGRRSRHCCMRLARSSKGAISQMRCSS